ncbi:phage major capsid protein [Amycolatopsis thermoflava]|uniref:phage major capsid protein n=1 Tax=Amycolatopsis thermoflava TaxID=84480 RepID=UPI00382C524E
MTEAQDTRTPSGGVEYADPGLQPDGTRRYRLDTEDSVREAWSAINRADVAAQYSAGDLRSVTARIKAAMKRLDIAVSENSTTEALISGRLSFDDIRELVRKAVRAYLQALPDNRDGYCWVYIVDISDTDVVYMDDADRLWQCSYALAGDAVTVGEPVEVARTYAPVGAPEDEPALEVAQRADTFDGRVLEAKGTDSETGGRIFRVQMIAYGDSKNGRRYPEAVLREAASLYEGAKAFDHHRSLEEMGSGTIQGLVGYYRNAAAGKAGLEADLHLLPSATHAAEALDAALGLQGEEPLVGISHDVMARFRPIQENGRQIQEATEITQVNSADIVSHPAAGGRATRVVAGGITPETDPAGTVPTGESTKETDVVTTKADILAALKEATDDELAAVGLSKATPAAGGTPGSEKKTETTAPAPGAPEGEPKGSFLGKLLIKNKVEDAGLPVASIESVTAALPDRITESDVDSQIAAIKSMLGGLERAGLAPSATTQVSQESLDKKKVALDAFFAGDYANGYRSFREAFVDITGSRPRSFDEDFNRTILRETFGGGFSSAARSTESLTTASWDVILGDSVTRRMIAEYGRPNLQTWRQIVSSVVPVNDFRTQRLDRMGGYGTLPTVGQGAPYQPLTSPGDEEATYAITKRGGTEDLTLEMIANDDIRAIQRIPTKLGLAAAQTLYRFVWDTFPTNAPTTYDATALFHANHGNTDNPAVLGQSTLSTGRRKMRQQAAYGDSADVLSIVPAFLVVPSALEEIAFQLCTSAVAIPSTPAGPSDTPNIHQGLKPIVVDYYSDTNDWFLVADPSLCPTIEIGFYQGREQPELFTQADQTVGSMFDADKLTYKIRHIYSGTVVDHRGFYRGAN